jgi:hypothetical protein
MTVRKPNPIIPDSIKYVEIILCAAIPITLSDLPKPTPNKISCKL